MAYQDFEECVRKEGMPICEFMREFDTKYFKMKAKNMSLPDEVLAFRLVKNCRLTDVQRNQVMASTKPLSFKEVRATLKRMFEASSVLDEEVDQVVKVKEEPVYVTKAVDEHGSKEVGYNTGERYLNSGEEDVMWTTNYGRQSGYSRNWNARYGRGNRYPGRNWRRMRYDSGCFECGAKDHWARNCEKRKVDNKEL